MKHASEHPRVGVALAVLTAVAVAGLAWTTPAAAEPFSGVYAGGDIGYEDSGRLGQGGGATYGAFIGVNIKALDRLVIGAEARIADSTISETVMSTLPGTIVEVRNSVGRSIGGSARIGWLAGDRTLLFGRVGYENVKVNSIQTRTPRPPTTNPNPTVSDFGFKDDTLTLGAGVEHFVTDSLSLRASYDWAENFDRHQLRLGAAFNF